MALKLITAPAVEPVTLADVKARLVVDHTDHDGLLNALIVSARQTAENRLGRALIHQTWELILDAFPSAEIKLARPPVVSVESIKYLDLDGVEQTLAAETYALDPDTLPGWVLPAYGESWPDTLNAANSVRVRYVAGYGAAADVVPMPIRQWMHIVIATHYAQREAIAGGTQSELPTAYVDGLLDPYLVVEYV